MAWLILLLESHVKTHGHVVSATKKDVWAHKCVIYTTSEVVNFNLS